MRYPSDDVARFDQQFAETEGERNARLRQKRLERANNCHCRNMTINQPLGIACPDCGRPL